LAQTLPPDAETGIGAWTDREFVSAMKSGIGRGGVHLYPAMPYVYYSKMADSDVLAIRAYLSTIEPVRNPVQINQLAFPFNIRAIMRVWNWLYLPYKDWQPDLAKSPEWNRGAYLVDGPMHCGACHTPKSLLGGDRSNRMFEGYSTQGWHAPNITNNNELGLGSWPEEQVTEYLKTGHNKAAGASGAMAEEVERSSSKISDDDLKAIANYLKSGKTSASEKREALPASDPAMKAGEPIYKDSCSACHQAKGSGVPGLFTDLRAAASVRASDPLSLVRVVIEGAKTASTNGAPTGPAMPSYAWQLSDAQIAAVLTYVRNSWGNTATPLSERTVRSAKRSISAGG
jgi:mono/diheme cytochrome c family protein